MVHRVAYLQAYNVLASLVINTNQTKNHFVSTNGERTWEKKGSKNIFVFGVEDKKQITIVVSFAVNGRFLPLQIIFIGSTTRCLPQNSPGKASCLGARFHLTYFANHWSTLETCQQFGEKDFNSLSQK
jgi:hypothetical protein